jgi:hypothetical protein
LGDLKCGAPSHARVDDIKCPSVFQTEFAGYETCVRGLNETTVYADINKSIDVFGVDTTLGRDFPIRIGDEIEGTVFLASPEPGLDTRCVEGVANCRPQFIYIAVERISAVVAGEVEDFVVSNLVLREKTVNGSNLHRNNS